MTIENLKQIAIKYATTKGSRVPLAPDELCNAVVQYFNEFLKITADINTLQVAVTEEGGNIVFTITGNTLDGKAFTPIVITVDHNDFVTDQEFEAFKTNILDTIESLNNSIAEINSTLDNKLDKITSVSNSNQVYGKSAAGENLLYNLESHPNAGYLLQYDNNGNIYVNKGSSEYTPANMQNIADVEAKIPSTDNFLLKNVVNIINYSKFKIIDEIGNNIIGKDDVSNNMSIGSDNYPMRLNSSMRPIVHTPIHTYQLAYISDVPAYKNVYSVSYDSTNGAIITYYGSTEIHIPLLAGENVTINASEDNKKIVISAAGGGGTGDVTAAGNNTFTGVNTFNNSIYAKNGVVAGDTTNYGANSVTKGSNTYSFPNKSGTFAMTTDVIKNPIYFISFYANESSETCHLIGTMMSKNSYGTGQKTNEEFAVMLADNLYTNSNEGLAAYGKLAQKDILCIYSADGLSIRCLDEENSEVDLPTVMFFVMETEL